MPLWYMIENQISPRLSIKVCLIELTFSSVKSYRQITTMAKPAVAAGIWPVLNALGPTDQLQRQHQSQHILVLQSPIPNIACPILFINQ